MSGNRLRGKSDIFEFDVEDIPPFAVMPLLNLIRELTTKHKLGNGVVRTTVLSGRALVCR